MKKYSNSFPFYASAKVDPLKLIRAIFLRNFSYPNRFHRFTSLPLDRIINECKYAPLLLEALTQGSELYLSYLMIQGQKNFNIAVTGLTFQNVCVHRNMESRKFVERTLTLDRLVAFLKQPIVQKLRCYQPFIKVVHHAYIDVKPFTEISRIAKGKFDIPRTQSQMPNQLLTIMDLINRFLHSFTWFDPSDMNQLKNAHTFLQLLKCTLNLGFWKTISQLQQMIPCILRMLRFDKDFAFKAIQTSRSLTQQKNEQQLDSNDLQLFKRKVMRNKAKLVMNKPQINLLVKCKILAAQILHIIIDMQNNIRVSLVAKLFKDILQMNIDISQFQSQKENLNNSKDHLLLNQQIWITKLTKMLDQRDLFVKVNRQQLNFTLILFQINHYKNTTLINHSLQLLKRIYGERNQILQNFCKMILVGKGQFFKLSYASTTIRTRLLTLANHNILTAKLENQGRLFQYQVWAQSQNIDSCGIIQILGFLAQSMKQGFSQNTKQIFNIYNFQDLYPYKIINLQKQQQQNQQQQGVYSIISQKENNNQLFQSLITSQDHHQVLLQFITIMGDTNLQMHQLPAKALHASYNFLSVLIWNHKQNKKLMSAHLSKFQKHIKYNVGCIQFLRQLFYNNKTLLINQNIVSAFVDQIVNIANQLQMNSYYKSKLMDFLRVLVIFDDKGYKKNQNIVMEVISRYQVSQNNKTVYVSNQSHFHIDFTDLKEWSKIWQKHYELGKYSYKLQVGPELTYIATFFQVFSALIQNKNIINLGKCTNMHPYEYLVKMLGIVGVCWPVTHYLRSYINKLYYSIITYQTKIFQGFIQMDLLNIQKQLKGIVMLIQNYAYYNQIQFKYGIRYLYLGSYVYTLLEEILNSLYWMLCKEQFINFMGIILGQKEAMQNYKAHIQLLQIAQMIGYLIKRNQSRYINRFLNKIQQFLKKILLNFNIQILKAFQNKNKQQISLLVKQNMDYSQQIPYKVKYIYYHNKSFFRNLIDMLALKKNQTKREKIIASLQRRIDKIQTKKNSLSIQEEKQKEKEYIVDYFFLGNIQKKIKIYKKVLPKPPEKKKISQAHQIKIQSSAKNLITSDSRNFRIKNQPELPPEKQNQLLNNRRNKLKEFIIKNQAFQDFKNLQFYQFCKQLQSVDEISEKTYDIVVISSADVIKSIVQMMVADYRNFKVQIKITFLSVLTNFIGQKNPKKYMKSSIDTWVSQDWLQNKKQIQKAQNTLNQCGCANLICTLIKQCLQSIDLMNEIFLFGIAFLLGGKSLCQNQILRILKKDQSNQIFMQLYAIIKKVTKNAGSYLKTRKQDLKFNRNKAFAYKMADTYDYYNDVQKIMVRKFGYQSQQAQQKIQTQKTVKALDRVFIFLRLLCKNNNINMKNFIRDQVNQDNSIKTNTINIIDLTTFQMRRLIKIMNKQIVKLPLSLMDFLNQVTQIPCVQNQKSLCKSTFFEDLCFLSAYFNDQSHRQMRNINKEQLLILTSIYNKSIQVALNCLQGNDGKIYRQLSQKIQPIYLIDIIKQNLTKNQINSIQQLDNLINNQGYLHNQQIRQILQVMFIVQKLGRQRISGRFNDFQHKASLYYPYLTPIIKKLKQEIKCIQIIVDKKQQFLFFPNHPVFNYLSSETKDKVMFQVNRDTPRDKLIGLFQYSSQLFNQIQYNFDLNHYKIPISLATIDFFRKWANYISLIIDVLMLYVMQVEIDMQYQYVAYNFKTYQMAYGMELLALTQLGFTGLFFGFWLLNRTPLAISKSVQQSKQQVQKQQTQKVQGQQEQVQRNYAFYLNQKISKIKQQIFNIYPIMALFSLLKYQNQFTNILIFVLASFLGAFYKIQFFAFHLFDTVGRIDILQNVFQAVFQNFKQLGVVSLLGVSFICVFSVFSLSSYVTSIYPQRMPADHCHNVPSCVITLYISQQIGSQLDEFQVFRFFFDLIYVIFMDMLFSNIISGIMIDTFASLRQRKKTINQDKKNNCFICGISRSTVPLSNQLQKNLKQLQSHIVESKHFLWNYIFYLYCLNNKKSKNQNFTGLQFQIFNKLQMEDVSWIPFVDQSQDDSQNKFLQLIQQIQKCHIQRQQKLQNIKSHINQIDLLQ